MDVGNRTACLWFVIDPVTGIHYAFHEYYREGQVPAVHAESIAQPGSWIPIAIDTAAHQRSQIDGENLFRLYQEKGLTLHNADKSILTGLYTVWELLVAGRLKFFDDLKQFKEEFLIYRRNEKGDIVKSNDHLMDCMRYAIMSGRDLACNKQEATTVTYEPTNWGQSPMSLPLRRNY
jgi:hypothetical protein